MRAELTARLGRTPRDAQLAADLGIAPDEPARLQHAGRAPAPLADEAAAQRGAKNGHRQFDVATGAWCYRRLQTLDPDEHEIICLRFLKDLSRKQTATEVGISEGRLSRRTQAALAKLHGELERRGSGQAAAVGTPPTKQPPHVLSESPTREGEGQPQQPGSCDCLCRSTRSSPMRRSARA